MDFCTRILPSVAVVAIAAAMVAGCGGGGDGTASAPTFDVVAAGDIGECGSGGAAASMAARTAALVQPTDALVLTLGDTTYPVGAAIEFTDCFQPTWGAFKDRIRPAPGNHEYYTAGADGYFGYFGTQAGPDRQGYYSFDFGGWHFIALNSNVDAAPGSPQYLWLLADLERSRGAKCTIAWWHYPVFSSGLHGSSPQMASVFEALYAAGVDVVLAGHDHHYERFAPQRPGAIFDPDRGVRSFVVGTGGASLYTVLLPRPNSELRASDAHGVLRLTLGDGSYRWQFVTVDGGPPRDTGQGACHG